MVVHKVDKKQEDSLTFLLQFTFICPLFWNRSVLLSLSKPHNLRIIKNKNESVPMISFHWLVIYLKGIHEPILANEMAVELTCEGFLSWKTRQRHQRKKLVSPTPFYWLELGEFPEQRKQPSCKLEMTSARTRANTKLSRAAGELSPFCIILQPNGC